MKEFIVVWDDECAFCARSMKRLQAVDIFHQLTPIGRSQIETLDRNSPTHTRWLKNYDNGLLDTGMWACNIATGQGFHGFYGMRKILASMPSTMLLGLLMYLWPINAIGKRVYAWVAANRMRWGCESSTCTLPKHAEPRSTEPYSQKAD